jgi:hypothetical protein
MTCRYITYKSLKVKTTDNTLKWVAYHLNGAKLLKPEEIVDWVVRLRKIVID